MVEDGVMIEVGVWGREESVRKKGSIILYRSPSFC
jgi:hypothetical protein